MKKKTNDFGKINETKIQEWTKWTYKFCGKFFKKIKAFKKFT